MTQETKRRGRPEIDLSRERFSYLMPYERVRIGNVTWWKCHCLGRAYGAGNCKQDRQPIMIRHTSLHSGLQRSCGCMRHMPREYKDVMPPEMRREPVTLSDYAKLGIQAPEWLRPVSVKGMDIDSDEYWAALDAMPAKDTD